MNIYPIRFTPIYKDYIWGGDRIIKKYNRKVPSGRYAESWEICDCDNQSSIVENGGYKGLSLASLLFEWQDKLIGIGRPFKKFPLLVKLLDSKEKLSIQVHPGELTAKKLKADPKNEAWYVLESNRSHVFVGFKHEVSKEIFKEAVTRKRLPEILRKINIKEGDVINIPGGIIHAVCEGSLLFEVQQNANATYRIYDWDRVDDEKKSRELHLLQAMQTIDFQDDRNPVVKPEILFSDENYTYFKLLQTASFKMEKVIIKTRWIFDSDQSSFQIYFCLKGSAIISADGAAERIICGQTYLVPALAKEIKIISENKECEILKVTLP